MKKTNFIVEEYSRDNKLQSRNYIDSYIVVKKWILKHEMSRALLKDGLFNSLDFPVDEEYIDTVLDNRVLYVERKIVSKFPFLVSGDITEYYKISTFSFTDESVFL